MSAGRITLTVDGVDQFDRVFQRLDAAFDDLSPIWPDLRDEFWRIEKEQFESEGGKGASGHWKQLSARYAAEKVHRYGPALKILEATGDLRESLTGNNAGSYYQTSKDEFAIGTVIPYGIYHHRGGGKLPKREVISISNEQKKRMIKIIQAGLVREIRGGSYYVSPDARPF